VIDEKQKIEMVKLLYTKEKLPEYYADIKKNIKYVKSFEANECSQQEAIKKFRDIDTVSIIPRIVYEDHEVEINVAIDGLKADYSKVDKDEARETRARARSHLIEFTVNISNYHVSKHENRDQKNK